MKVKRYVRPAELSGRVAEDIEAFISFHPAKEEDAEGPLRLCFYHTWWFEPLKDCAVLAGDYTGWRGPSVL
jgi:hypothetical protein